MKKKIFFLLGIGLFIMVMSLTILRQDEAHVSVVEFEYARTMEFKNAITVEQKSRLREISVRSLKSLFEDWKYGSVTGEVPLYKRVKHEFQKEYAKRGEMTDGAVDRFLRLTRFEIVDAPTSEMPIRGRIVVDTGPYEEANNLAKVYIGCIKEYIEEENENWALKATMDRGLVVQRLEREVSSLKQQLSSRQLNESELDNLRALIASNELAVCRAKVELAEAKRKYHETYDGLMVFVDDRLTPFLK